MRGVWAGLPVVGALLACGGLDLPTPDAHPPPSGPQASTAACDDGIEVVELWAGEYPEPVVWIDAPTDLPVRAAPCAEPWRTCPVGPGLYHPWAPENPDHLAFATLSTVERYEVVKPFELTDGVDVVQVTPGITVEVPTYLGEGICAYRIPQASGAPLETVGNCPPLLADPEAVQRVGGPADATPGTERGPQLVRVACEDSPDPDHPILGWVLVDDALLARPTIQEGRITGFGEVAPPE